ncbi:MAG: transcriptional regulator [Thermoplasmata archaeon]
MDRFQIIERAREILAKAGFYLSERHNERGISFDIIARKDDNLLIISVLVNADTSRPHDAKELKILADSLEGSPFLLAEHGGRKPLERGVIYSRRGIPLISLNTMEDLFLEGVPPYVFSAPGGFYVSINSEMLRKARNQKQISLRKMAEVAGVSRKAIQKYEDGMGVDLEVAMRMEEYLGEDLIMPLNPLEYSSELEIDPFGGLDEFSEIERIIFGSLHSMGYQVIPTCHAPFEAVTSKEKVVLLSGVGDEEGERLKKKARIVSNLTHITEKESVLFLKKRYTRVNLEGIPLIEKDELEDLTSSRDVLELLRERKTGGH